ncbi:hypothetical protein EVAR_16489_1 [Eumeta japonica]|uniref:Uncharacterized protein n=1 Tax=Eumeta variegata TaxID=151549 RepID=A0A4C1ULD8_EUMVA|nr:hypothetical protein EVAR_16489_1 [Eumeta japonica]
MERPVSGFTRAPTARPLFVVEITVLRFAAETATLGTDLRSSREKSLERRLPEYCSGRRLSRGDLNTVRLYAKAHGQANPESSSGCLS